MNVLRPIGCLLLLVGSALGCAQDTKVGAVISRTGATAPYGQSVAKGMDLALDEINAEGGFKGTPLELIYRDDETNVDVGKQAVTELIEQEKVGVIIGAISSPVTLEIAKICEAKKVVLLSPSSSAPAISDAGQYVFRNYPSDILEGTAMADFARAHGLRKMVVVAVNNDFGRGLMGVFSRQFESKSRKVLKAFLIDGAEADEIADVVEEIGELNPDGVYIVAYLNEMAALLQRFEQAGVGSVLLGTSSVTEALPKMVGSAAERLVYPNPGFNTESKDPAVAAFVEAFRERYHEDPDSFAAHGYDALKLVWRAMVETGQTRPEEIKRGLLNMKYQGAAGRTAFDERGDVVRYPKLLVVRDGRPMPYDQFEADGGKLTPGDRG